MKKLTTSPTQTLKATATIACLLIAAMTFNGCEKMEITPDGIKQDSQDMTISHDNLLDEDMVAKIYPESQDMTINHSSSVNENLTAKVMSDPSKPALQLQISSEIDKDSENKPNGYGGSVTTDPTTTIKVYPRD